jgi:hypothetical protein
LAFFAAFFGLALSFFLGKKAVEQVRALADLRLRDRPHQAANLPG